MWRKIWISKFWEISPLQPPSSSLNQTELKNNNKKAIPKVWLSPHKKGEIKRKSINIEEEQQHKLKKEGRNHE